MSTQAEFDQQLVDLNAKLDAIGVTTTNEAAEVAAFIAANPGVNTSALQGVVDRLTAANAGVDAIFLVGMKSRAELDAVAAANIGKPLILGGVPGELSDKAYLASKGVRVALQGHQQFAAAVQGIYTTLKHLRDGGKPSDLKGIASEDLMKKVTRAADYDTWAQEWLN